MKYYQNKPRFNDVCSRDKLPIIKDGAYVINLDEYSDIELIGLIWYFCIGFIDITLKGNTLNEFTSLLSLNNFRKNDDITLNNSGLAFKMAECNSHNIYPNLSDTPSNEQKFWLNKINEIKDYFFAEIKERELMSKRLSKYIAPFDYFDETLIVLSVTTGSTSIATK